MAAAAGSRKRRAITYDVTSKKKRKIEDKKEEEELCPILKSIDMLPALCKEKILFHWVMDNLQNVDTYDDVQNIDNQNHETFTTSSKHRYVSFTKVDF